MLSRKYDATAIHKLTAPFSLERATILVFNIAVSPLFRKGIWFLKYNVFKWLP